MELDVATTWVTNAPKFLSLVSNFSCSVFTEILLLATSLEAYTQFK